MFNLLKKKITGLVGNITKSITGEKKEDKEPKELTAEKQEEKPEEIKKMELEPKIIEKKQENLQQIETQKESELEIARQESEIKKETEISKKNIITVLDEQKTEIKDIHKKKKEAAVKELEETSVKESGETAKHIEKQKPIISEQASAKLKEKELKETEISIKPSLLTKVKALIVPEITIKENDIQTALDDFELQLITADVALPVSEEIISELRKKLVGTKVKSNEIEKYILNSIYKSIDSVIQQEEIDLVSEIQRNKKSTNKPYKILFLGPNGAGKTTTIAKVAHYFMKNGLKCVIAASDTFRAAAIEQTIEHAKRLGIPYIKHDYSSDPAAVAFDAIKYAESKGIDVVLIDSAGRQETNRNLIEELKKIERVVAPNKKIFVGEGIAGNALLTQVTEFNEAVKLDGVILTKLDVDAKGGTIISVKKATGVPILFIGVGQEYDDLIPFNKEYIIKRIMSEN